MCEKCIRAARRLGHKPLTYGQIKFLAHTEDIPVFSLSVPGGGSLAVYRDVPLFKNRGINYAIQAHQYKIKRKKTNKKIYNRKRLDPVV